jgi:hypothetical protein
MVRKILNYNQVALLKGLPP